MYKIYSVGYIKTKIVTSVYLDHNIHILVKIISENGDPEMLFIGFEEPEI